MRLHIIAVGRVRAGPERDIFEAYRKRLPWPVETREVETRRQGSRDELRRDEAQLLLKAVPDGARIVALDERGTAPSSADFAARIGRWRDDGVPALAFLIGGADGLDDEVRRSAAMLLSLGPMTWPHQLVRAMLAEQLYRASSILAGHPYHRA